MAIPTRQSSLERAVVSRVMPAVVQIVALQKSFLGNYSPAWTGSGTVVDPRGIVLTNCHVANPRALGLSAPEASHLAIAVTQRSDEAPALTYLAKIVAQSPELDLAVLKIVSGLDGKAVSSLNLPSIPVGDSDGLELGDTLHIFGYPGIGGETVTFTQGAVSGFSKEKGVTARRAWVKTDATIAGGNSGGTAVNDVGQLVGVPTQAAAGSGITPVDARPVVDTTGDGKVDHRDTPMAIGGFINGLRPVNLAKPLLAQAGVQAQATAPQSAGAAKPAVKPAGAVKPAAKPSAIDKIMPSMTPQKETAGPRFSTLLFSAKVTNDGRPIQPAQILPSGTKVLYASFDYDGMSNGTPWGVVWALNGEKVAAQDAQWQEGTRGRKVLQLTTPNGLPDGQYHLALTVRKQVVAEGTVVVGRQAEDTDTQVSGQLVGQKTGKGIPDALVIVLKPGVSARTFVQQQSKEMAFTSARTDKSGRFSFPQQLPKGQAYGLVVVARGYRDLAIEGALRIGAQAPEQAQMNPIPMTRG